jgi:dodecin
MSDNVYSISEIVGTSPDGVDAAIRNAISRASRTLRNLDWFEVAEVRGYIGEGGIDHFQVRLKVGFRLEDDGG